MVEATFVQDIRGEGGDVPGAIEMRHMGLDPAKHIAGFAFRCPCGCGGESWLPIANGDRDGWQWNGNREKPTLTPSILQSGFACKWHGYLTDGEFRPC